MKKNVVIGVSGGIAAYKALDVVSALRKANCEVDVIMTKNATEFVSPLTFQSLSNNKVVVNMFEEPKYWEIQHIALAKKADLFMVIPATANVIGKIANGIADDMLTTTIMATKAPVIFAPAMNVNMYENVIVQDNINKLKKLGYEFIEPSEGILACGDTGKGKLADTKLITKIALSKLYGPKDLKGKKVLITAGPTIAKIDPVRYITNHSTGKMGYAIAEEARDRGAEVVLISGPSSLDIPFGMKFKKVTTNEEMLQAVLEEFDNSDIVIKSAAVADYKPVSYSDEKIKKGNGNLNLELTRDNDILMKLGELKKNQILVGFAAESHDLEYNAKGKLERKNLDYIVANNIASSEVGFGSNNNKVTVYSKENKVFDLEIMSKNEVAKNLIDIITKKR